VPRRYARNLKAIDSERIVADIRDSAAVERT
jgi:hypothetical protein